MYEIPGTMYPNLPSYARDVTTFNAEQQLKQRIRYRLLAAISTAEHQHDEELKAGLKQALRIVEES